MFSGGEGARFPGQVNTSGSQDRSLWAFFTTLFTGKVKETAHAVIGDTFTRIQGNVFAGLADKQKMQMPTIFNDGIASAEIEPKDR